MNTSSSSTIPPKADPRYNFKVPATFAFLSLLVAIVITYKNTGAQRQLQLNRTRIAESQVHLGGNHAGATSKRGPNSEAIGTIDRVPQPKEGTAKRVVESRITAAVNLARSDLKRTPEGKRVESIITRNRIKIDYAPFLARYAQSPAVVEQLLAAFVAYDEDNLDQAIGKIIGESGSADFKEFSSTRPYRRELNDLDAALRYGPEPLTDSAIAELALLLKKFFDYHPEKSARPFPDEFIAGAAAILRPAQMKALESIQARRIETTQVRLELKKLSSP